MNPSYIFIFLTTIQHLSSYTSIVATQVNKKSKPNILTVLQWDARGLRTRLPDLRQHLLLNHVDVLAIQQLLTQPGDFRLSPYVIYNSATALANGRSRARLLVNAELLHNHVDLYAFFTQRRIRGRHDSRSWGGVHSGVCTSGTQEA